MGRAAVIQAGTVTVLVSERPVSNIPVDLFRSQGIEPREKKFVVVKSAGGFRVDYDSIAAAIFMVDTPGVSSANLRSIPFRRVRRPMYPFEEFEFQVPGRVHSQPDECRDGVC